MIYILIYTILTEVNSKYLIIDKEEDLSAVIGKLKGIGAQITMTLYKAEQVDFTFKLEDKTETVITKVPKVDIIK